MATYQPNMATVRPYAPGASSLPSAPAAPAGTFLPGTKVQVGNHRVIVDKYLSEGGFAHVYVVTLPKPVEGYEKAVLKRVAVPDKEHLANMRTEVETMKRLRGHKHIVKYIDSHASPLKAGGFEVFLLMEWCNGGGLIDFMNTRLQNRLTEPEILKIFTDVAEGVACMHYLKPALMHRDLKVENVLISTDGKARTFKLCDFGSAAPARPAATTAAEGRLIEDDVQRHTTLQYRSPEMIDVYRKQPIDEKSDIWALGCFLYKLCYYTTPFEEVGQMAILNARFKYPGYPRFSDELKLLIASMLREQPSQRPNIYQVLAKASKMDGRPLTVRDIYSNRSKSEDAHEKLSPDTTSSQSRAGATLAPPKQEHTPVVPQIEPMRRGRPTQPTSHHASAKPSPSPLRMIDNADAFAHLDGGAGNKDELSSKFPKLEEFSLLTDKSSTFAFQSSAQKAEVSANGDLARRVTEALADDAFARPSRPASPPKPQVLAASRDQSSNHPSVLQKKGSVEAKASFAAEATSMKPTRTQMVSTGTMTSPSPPPVTSITVSDRPVWQVPDGDTPERLASTTQGSSRTKPVTTKDKSGSRLANLLQSDATRSQLAHEQDPKSPTSSRPSLEGGRPLLRELDSGVQRSKSLNVRHRPVSVNIGARPTHINDKEIRQKPQDMRTAQGEADFAPLEHAISDSNTNIKSDLEFLRAREEEEREKHKRLHRLSGSTRHQKRASLPSVALSGTKNLLQGRFGDAFRKFEGHGETQHQHHHEEAPTSPGRDDHHILTPIAGSEATDLSDDRRGLDETEELSSELRRELEKQELEAEERRVERAAAEYRQRIGVKGAGPPPLSAKAASIQNRVQSLLKENEKPAQKTASGYGRFTADANLAKFEKPLSETASSVRGNSQPEMKPVSAPASAIDLQAQSRMQRPAAPPKPRVLRTGMSDSVYVSKDPVAVGQDNWEEDFSKKYPALSHLEMVETDIDTAKPHQLRMKEV
ncbi:Ark- serine/threonine protein kinase [Neophaeococcomyces mojaviensis]|uniref:Ark- serine/threonine protein kinase n=1 Tax=Neophaeococcomyces mojaviensis TaxID=3383035 RepID=A0ACC3A5A0_9EURO|nr:Ark- serine/threonine protein kinase [Knufia sp. JES_112]